LPLGQVAGGASRPARAGIERGDFGGVGRTGPEGLGGWPLALEKPPLPDARGEITLGDVEAIEEPEAWREAVRAWAVATWEAYGELHPVARRWAAEAGRG